MKVSELIVELRKAKKEHGDRDVVASGLYDSFSDDITVKFSKRTDYGKNKIVIVTDLMTG
jgi:hypothetical protein